MIFLDANSVIYLIEQPPGLGPKVSERITALLTEGENLAVSDLVRMECLVGPLKKNDERLLARYMAFFNQPEVQVLSISPTVCDLAARIRAVEGFQTLDSLHLASAFESRCKLFLTSDVRLKKFSGIALEILN